MDHQEAAKMQAVERYLLGELPADQREAFEEHFFECPECGEDLITAAIFVANARAVLKEETHQSVSRRTGASNKWVTHVRRAQAIALAVTVLLLALSTYLLVVAIPGLKRELARVSAPQSYLAVFLRAATRGEDQVIEIAKDTRFVGLSLDVPPERVYGSYECELVGEPGWTGIAVRLAAPARPGGPLDLLVPSSSFRPGRYTLILYGVNGPASRPELNRYTFVIQTK